MSTLIAPPANAEHAWRSPKPGDTCHRGPVVTAVPTPSPSCGASPSTPGKGRLIQRDTNTPGKAARPARFTFGVTPLKPGSDTANFRAGPGRSGAATPGAKYVTEHAFPPTNLPAHRRRTPQPWTGEAEARLQVCRR